MNIIRLFAILLLGILFYSAECVAQDAAAQPKGLRVRFGVAAKPPAWPASLEKRAEIIEKVRDVVVRRIAALDFTPEVSVVVEGDDQIIVTLPDAADYLKLVKIVGGSNDGLKFYLLKDITGPNNPKGKWRMESDNAGGMGYTFFGPKGVRINSSQQPAEVLSKIVKPSSNPPVLTGKDIMQNAKAGINNAMHIYLALTFSTEGTKRLAKFTRTHVGDILAIFYGDKLLSAPRVNEPIVDGQAEVTGFSSLAEAKNAAAIINAGTMPVPLKLISKETVELK